MDLEEKKVLFSRKHLFKDWREKEWWYTGIHDPSSKIYFSFFFIRTKITDHFNMMLFNYGDKKEKIEYSKNLFLESAQVKNNLCLNYHSKELNIEYNGNDVDGWTFRFSNNKFNVNIAIKSTTKPFTKFDNNFVNQYTLLHFFHNVCSGTIETSENKYKLQNGLGYYDHCFGRVPRKSGWHWIAVQNEAVALASLINYGGYSQKYTQIYFKRNSKNFKLNQWIRLNQEVSFESCGHDNLESDWRLTSCDMDLIIKPILHTSNTTVIPPIIPLLINITHLEAFVEISGKVRIDSEWIEVENLYGVLEEHFGTW